jgi:hypothetical protein
MKRLQPKQILVDQKAKIKNTECSIHASKDPVSISLILALAQMHSQFA